jgi:penicillin-binding protein 1B
MIDEIEQIGHQEEVANQSAPPPLPPEPAERKRRIVACTVAGLLAAGTVLFVVFYVKYGRLIDKRLAAGPFSETVNVYAAPLQVAPGGVFSPDEILAGLQRSGYTPSHSNSVGWYSATRDTIAIFPGRDSHSGVQPAVLEFKGGKISRITSPVDHKIQTGYELPPALITNISDRREQRRLVHFADIPPVLVQAVTSVEDKHFFHHTGFDLFRILKAGYVDMKDGRKEQGASTLTMQLARGLWLEPDKLWTRKAQELLMTMHLERKLSKQQIFEDYANQVYLGRQGTFSINGFGEGARAFFDKDLSQLTAPEAALLAGLVQRPSYLNPFRYPDRARDRRNVVLALMRDNGYLSPAAYTWAVAQPVRIASERSSAAAPHFLVDLATGEMQTGLGEREKEARSIYTTVDPQLQAAAEEAVRLGMENVDRQLAGGKPRHAAAVPKEPQVALVAIDPRTGAIKALVGGRNYDTSQLNHAMAMRQPGSVFKPFVYAAALNSAISGGQQIFTPATILDDSPTSFVFNGAVYQPGNFGNEYLGEVTLRTALAHSLNAATVSLAQQVGLQRVASLALRAGLADGIQATPSMALGAYESTPLQVAGAYTIFANHGVRVTPSAIASVRGADGAVLMERQEGDQKVLDPRVAYLMTDMMQEVLRSGTGAGVRARGFALPAAGKTGTSRDGWFAGYTSELLCVVWVGYDDNHDLKLEGARSALPIWTEFMKRAAVLSRYRDAKEFPQPAGVMRTEICDDSGQLAGPQCPRIHSEVFIDGTEPGVTCELHSAEQNSANRVIEMPEAAVKH